MKRWCGFVRLTVLLQVLLARGDELDGNELEAIYVY